MPRLKYGSLIRIIVILCLFCLWVQIMLSASSGGMYREDYYHDEIQLQYLLLNAKHSAEELMNGNDTSEQVLALVPQELHKYLTVHPKNNSINATERIGPKNITEIHRAILKYNDAQIIYNEDVFGPVQNDTIIIAIQVHTRLTYLRHLIVSLAQARDIDKTLLIFSHDYYDEEINTLVRSIDFTKVMQIFYPYSIQTHPNEFPGMDPNDCPRDAKFDQAVKLKCNNAHHPDLHGHYREAKYTQTKHHWWWKANRIFNQLQCTAHHTGMEVFLEEDHYIAADFIHMLRLLRETADNKCPQCEILSLGTYLKTCMVVFLEEDHYVAADFIHMLRLLRETADNKCPQCEILSLGTYLKTYQYHANSDKRKKQLTLNYIQQVKAANEERRKRQDYTSWNFQVYPNLYSTVQKVEITPWHSSMHNMGFAFNRTVWSNIMELQSQFCAYDDYNWDYSLLHLSQNRPGREKFKVIVCKGPRVFHIGECGIHHKKSNCNASTVISKVQKLLKNAKQYMFPSRVTATITSGGPKHNKKLTKGNGGWGDIRDQELCTNMTKIGREPRKYYIF